MSSGYTIEEIEEWFLHGVHNKKMKQPLTMNSHTYNKHHTDFNGIYLQEPNTVIILEKGFLHNGSGPAKVIMTKEGKPYHSIFARNGEIIQWDGFEATVRGTQIKKKYK